MACGAVMAARQRGRGPAGPALPPPLRDAPHASARSCPEHGGRSASCCWLHRAPNRCQLQGCANCGAACIAASLALAATATRAWRQAAGGRRRATRGQPGPLCVHRRQHCCGAARKTQLRVEQQRVWAAVAATTAPRRHLSCRHTEWRPATSVRKLPSRACHCSLGSGMRRLSLSPVAIGQPGSASMPRTRGVKRCARCVPNAAGTRPVPAIAFRLGRTARAAPGACTLLSVTPRPARQAQRAGSAQGGMALPKFCASLPAAPAFAAIAPARKPIHSRVTVRPASSSSQARSAAACRAAAAADGASGPGAHSPAARSQCVAEPAAGESWSRPGQL